MAELGKIVRSGRRRTVVARPGAGPAGPAGRAAVRAERARRPRDRRGAIGPSRINLRTMAHAGRLPGVRRSGR
ncbi:hypothetical protein ACIPYS_28665 [Kitasatospora sp. NPDC089913]|uniref:hypothetical protein n=1 Tax=Kitasatospora sp. NPDC089913 TaxID=3364080 RepID=UPI0037FC09F7